jgi:hypothetical protein
MEKKRKKIDQMGKIEEIEPPVDIFAFINQTFLS